MVESGVFGVAVSRLVKFPQFHIIPQMASCGSPSLPIGTTVGDEHRGGSRERAEAETKGGVDRIHKCVLIKVI